MAYYRKAFLLDDDYIANFLLESTLEEQHIAHQIQAFTDFKLLIQAFATLAAEPVSQDDLPDLLLLDMHMPGQDGLEVLDQLLHIPGIGGSKVCVFLMSASFSEALAEKIKAYPVSGYLVKPIEAPAIQQLIRSAVKDDCEMKETGLAN